MSTEDQTQAEVTRIPVGQLIDLDEWRAKRGRSPLHDPPPSAPSGAANPVPGQVVHLCDRVAI